MGVIVVAGTATPGPSAPQLLTPANGSYVDANSSPIFSWRRNPRLPLGTYTLFMLVNGGPTNYYWNNTSHTFQTTPVANNTPSPPVTIVALPATSPFLNGNSFQWSVYTANTHGTGPAAPFWTFTTQAAPVVTVTSPVGTVDQADPIVSWTVALPGSAVQTTYRAIIYDNTQYSAGGFTPGSGPSHYDSGVVGSTAQSIDLSQIPVLLPNGTQFRAYVQVTETGGQTSAWAYAAFTTSWLAPKTPTVTAVQTTDATTGCPVIQVTVQAADNLISAVDANGPAPSGTSYVGTNCTFPAQSQMQSTAGGVMRAMTASGLAGYPVQPNTQYTAIASFQAAPTGRTCLSALQWYDAAGAAIGGVNYGAFITDNNSTPTQAFQTITSPANAAFVAIGGEVRGTAVNEIHDVTNVGLNLGTDTTWGPGGIVGVQDIALLRSDGVYVRNASILNPLVPNAVTQHASILDYEVISGVNYSYQATVFYQQSDGGQALSLPGTSNVVNYITTKWWEFDPLNPSTAIAAQMIAVQPQVTEQSTAHLVMGQGTPIIIANAMGGLDGTATAETFDQATYQGLVALLQAQTTVFLSSPFGVTDSGYVRFGPQTGGMSSGVGNKVKDSTLLPSTLTGMHRSTALSWVAQLRPPV